jgi:hypothetical protein
LALSAAGWAGLALLPGCLQSSMDLSTEESPASSDAFADGRECELSLPGGERLRYPLNGSNAAWPALAQCAGF